MIKECNFKYKFSKGKRKGQIMCEISISALVSCFTHTTGIIHKREEESSIELIVPKECSGEDNCILYQLYNKIKK